MEKTRTSLILISFVFILFSCEDDRINMMTKIYPDGSCTREFIQNTKPDFIVGDTAKSYPFSFEIDSLWKIEVFWDTENGKQIHEWPFSNWTKDTTNKKENLKARATRHFTDVEELNKCNFFEHSDWKSFQPKIKFEKKFKWFYTYYHFKECYFAYKPFKISLLTDYLNEEEIKMWFQGDDEYFNGLNGIEINDRLNDIEKKYEKWLERNIFEEQYNIVLSNLNLLDNPLINKSSAIAIKDTIFEKYRKLEDDFPELLQILDTAYQTHAFSEIMGKNKDIGKETENLFNFLDNYTTSVNYSLIMPGKILNENSTQVKGDTLAWHIDTYRFTEYDYEIYAESRKPNIWAFVVSGIFILGVGLSYFKRLQ